MEFNVLDNIQIGVNMDLANILGVDEAIVLHKIHYWINVNEKNGINYKDGRYWTFNSLKQWNEKFFAFWSESKVKRIFASLENMGILIVGCFNKSKFDRTKWYSIDYAKLDEMIRANNGQKMKECSASECDNGVNENETMDNDNLSYCIGSDWHDGSGQFDSNNTNKNTNNTTYIKQQQRKFVVAEKEKEILKEFLGDAYTDSYFDMVISALEKKGEDSAYLQEKINIAKGKKLNSKCGFLLEAIKNDYKDFASDRAMSGNSFINFEQTVCKYSKDELDEKIRRKQEKMGWA